ncbi:hypothetical protein NNRS527_02657 [Nitrosospira sp. NRS527]|nr:hypothetical protein NNRS527_02657 [Nitrosospira sp. NRS527]
MHAGKLVFAPLMGAPAITHVTPVRNQIFKSLSKFHISISFSAWPSAMMPHLLSLYEELFILIR